MSWVVANDIAQRIRALRSALGDSKPLPQEELGRRAGVRTSQVSQWERGLQRPSRSRLERWAEREGWPIEIFSEGGPQPSDVLSALPDPSAISARANGPSSGTPDELLARFYEVMAESSRAGRPCPAELAMLIQEMHSFTRVEQGGTAVTQTSGASGAEGESPRRPPSEVPGW